MAGTKDETWMVLDVDLSCPECLKKIKKILAKFVEIQDQVYEKKKNIIHIKAVGCCPEKLHDKLYRKGKKIIKSIYIIKPNDQQPPAAVSPPGLPPPPPPPQGNVVEGKPIQAKYLPFELGYGCPVCPGNNVSCPFCHGYGKIIPQPPPADTVKV